MTFSYVVADADDDLVVAAVIGPRFKLNKLEPETVIGNPTIGRGTFTWDTTAVPPGDYPLTAKLDDGADVDVEGNDDFIIQELGTVTLP